MDTAAGNPDRTGATTSDRHGDTRLRVDVIPSTRLVLTGELDRTTAEVLRRTVAEVLRDPAPAMLEIDAGHLSFLDSSGIRGLLVCRKSAEEAGSRLLMVDAAPHVYRILEVTGLLDLFAVSRRVARSGTHTSRTRDEAGEQPFRPRQTSREGRPRTAAVRDDDALRSLRVPGRPSPG